MARLAEGDVIVGVGILAVVADCLAFSGGRDIVARIAGIADDLGEEGRVLHVGQAARGASDGAVQAMDLTVMKRWVLVLLLAGVVAERQLLDALALVVEVIVGLAESALHGVEGEDVREVAGGAFFWAVVAHDLLRSGINGVLILAGDGALLGLAVAGAAAGVVSHEVVGLAHLAHRDRITDVPQVAASAIGNLTTAGLAAVDVVLIQDEFHELAFRALGGEKLEVQNTLAAFEQRVVHVALCAGHLVQGRVRG